MFQSKYAKAGDTDFCGADVFKPWKSATGSARNPEYVRRQENGARVLRPRRPGRSCIFMTAGSLVTKTGEVTRAVEQILGFNYGQFTQIAMIAQGDFQKLLLADTAERERFSASCSIRSFFLTCRTVSGRKKMPAMRNTGRSAGALPSLWMGRTAGGARPGGTAVGTEEGEV